MGGEVAKARARVRSRVCAHVCLCVVLSGSSCFCEEAPLVYERERDCVRVCQRARVARTSKGRDRKPQRIAEQRVPAEFAERFWNVVRENIGSLGEMGDWWDMFSKGADASVEDEDTDFIAQAISMLGEPPYADDTWSTWTGAVKEATGRKGKGGFFRLNPDAPMRDSGIPWLDEVPEHWDVRKLKFAATHNDESLSESTDPDVEIAYVDISSVDLVEGITGVENLTFEEAPSRARRVVNDGDTIISTVRTYLKAIAAIENPPENMIVSTGFAVIRPLEFMRSGYLGYALQGAGFVDCVVANSTGVSYPAINPTSLVTIPIAFPPNCEEQEDIATFIQRESMRMDVLTAKTEEAISRLTEYRTALITAATTGKIDIREVEIPPAA